MTLELRTIGIEKDLEEFRLNLQEVNMEEVKENTLRSFSNIMANKVRQAIIADPDINSPASEGPYESGPGPSMHTKKAWIVEPKGDSYTVRPHPRVEQRAIVLNNGWGTITPTDAEALRFTINGVPFFADHVEGPKASGYWEKAFENMQKQGDFERVAEDELQKEIQQHF